MRKICSWCKAELNSAKLYDPHIISHGICKECLDIVLDSKRIPLMRCLNEIIYPVVVIDVEKDRVKFANNLALSLFKKRTT